MLFKKSQRGWRLMWQSIALLAEQKKIWLLSLASRAVSLILITALSVLVAVIRRGIIDYDTLSQKEILWGYVVIILVLWLGNLASTYFNSALIACLVKVEQGERISLSAALSTADQRFGVILFYVIMHYGCGGVITFFRSKLAQLKPIHSLLSGLNWVFASFLSLPLIITEPAGFFPTLQHSSQLISRNFGQNPKINFSHLFLSLLLRIIGMVPLIIGFYLRGAFWIALGSMISFLIILTVAVAFNAISVTILYAFYEFLAHGKTIRHFKTDDIANLLNHSA